MTEVFYLSNQTYLIQQTSAGNSCKQDDSDVSVGFFPFSSIPQIFSTLEITDRRVGSFGLTLYLYWKYVMKQKLIIQSPVSNISESNKTGP